MSNSKTFQRMFQEFEELPQNVNQFFSITHRKNFDNNRKFLTGF